MLIISPKEIFGSPINSIVEERGNFLRELMKEFSRSGYLPTDSDSFYSLLVSTLKRHLGINLVVDEDGNLFSNVKVFDKNVLNSVVEKATKLPQLIFYQTCAPSYCEYDLDYLLNLITIEQYYGCTIHSILYYEKRSCLTDSEKLAKAVVYRIVEDYNLLGERTGFYSEATDWWATFNRAEVVTAKILLLHRFEIEYLIF